MNSLSPDSSEQMDQAEPWSRLWKTGVLHSCATGMKGNYDGPTLAFWRRQFQTLQNGAKVVDIGTGNGALLLMALQHAEQHRIDLRLHGIDIADIDPMRSVPEGSQRFKGIRFHPRTSASRMPFSDGEIDLVCSQFGFEYAPRDATIAEISRISSQHGRIALVLHSDDSIIAEVSSDQREGHRFLRESSPILELTQAMIPIIFHVVAEKIGRDSSPLPRAEATRAHFNRSAEDLMGAIEQFPDARILRVAAHQIRSALEQAPRFPERSEQIIRELSKNVRDEETRITQQQEAQLSPSDLLSLANRLSEHRYNVQYSALEQLPGVKIGWAMEAVRA